MTENAFAEYAVYLNLHFHFCLYAEEEGLLCMTLFDAV